MTDCTNCGGRGHTGLRNGDDDLLCPTCNGTGEQPVGAAVAEALSEEAQLRIDLGRFDSAFDGVVKHSVSHDQVKYRREFTIARAILIGNLSADFHMLLDLLDAERKASAELREQVSKLTDELTKQKQQTDRFYGFYDEVVSIIENGEPGTRFQAIEMAVDTL